ncbi:MAG: transcriptional regulator [Deltaproteobacteria bacterium]|nr:transcriptional regulator [Deltaproteobacteria bacterium]
MTKSELLQIIANGENSGVEFKRDNIRPEQLAKEVVAIANLQGGKILLGVDNDGTIIGISRPDLETWVMDTVFGRYVHPIILPYYEEVLMEDRKRIAVISFPQGISKPYVVRHHNREDVYIRVGSTSRLATREQQARLYSIGGMLHAETMPVPGTSPKSLDFARLDNYLRDILLDPDIPETATDWEIRLQRLGFLVAGADGHSVCTIAGLLLFGIKPRRYLKQTGLRLMAFPGNDKEYQALLDEVLDFPLTGRFMIEKKSKTLVDPGLVEHFAAAISPFISREAAEIDQDMRREKIWLYPFEAVREIVINALAHRDWTRFMEIEVCCYADRMEVISPGALQNSMTIEKMIAGQRSSRNPIIVEVLRDYGYVDARGMGIRTKVIPLMKAAGQEPVFEATDDYVKTVLGQIKRQSKPKNAPLSINKEASTSIDASLSGLQQRIIDWIIENKSISYDKLAVLSGKDKATIRRNIQKLKKSGRLERLGSKKTGYWRVL